MRNKIHIQNWLDFKPYERQAITDSYYLNICNQVKRAIMGSHYLGDLYVYLEKEDIDSFVCFLTSYFEDLISETNIWNTFVKIHQRLYKTQLPFYELDEYYEEEINLEDIKFLIWYFINTLEEGKFITPSNNFITEIAEKVMEVFEKAWEYAPVNKRLKSFYQIDENEDDFYIARRLIDTILFKTYLFYPDTGMDLREQEFKIILENKDKTSPEEIDRAVAFLNESRDFNLNNSHTRLLSLKGKEWAAEMLGDQHNLYKNILNISQKIVGFFFYKGQDDDCVFIEHIASGKKFKLTKKSFDHWATLKEVDTIVYLGIVKWKNEWWFSGMFFEYPFIADLVLNEKNSLQSRMAVSFLDHQHEKTHEILEKQLTAFKDFNNGSQIAFMPSTEIEEFLNAYMKYYTESLNLSPKEEEEAEQRARKEGFFGKKEMNIDYTKVPGSGLVFFNPKSGVEMTSEVISAFPLPNNPYFKAENSRKDIIYLLISNHVSTAMAMFCINNCKDDLPFFTKGAGKQYLKDIDFLLRFWKRSNYFAKPHITFTGQDNKYSV